MKKVYLQNLPEAIYTERVVKDLGYHSLACVNELSWKYQFTNRKYVLLNALKIPHKHPYLHKVGEFIPSSVLENDGYVYFPLHPDAFDDISSGKEKTELYEILTSPSLINKEYYKGITTVTSRTFLCENKLIKDEKYFNWVKVHINRHVSRSLRDLYGTSLTHGYDVSCDLYEFLKTQPKGFEDFHFFPEHGYSFGKDIMAGISCLFRPSTPISMNSQYHIDLSDRYTYLSLFVLYGNNCRTHSKPLILQLAKQHNMSLMKYLDERILEPHIRHWTLIAQRRGMLMQNHAQNTVFIYDRKLGDIIGLAYRDLSSTTIDPRIRYLEKLNSNNFRSHKIGGPDRLSAEQEYSVIYDCFIGQMFDRILFNLKEYTDFHEKEFINIIKSHFHNYFPNYKNYFPDGLYLKSAELEKIGVRMSTKYQEPPLYR
jgi:hypothetical protein